MVRAGTNVVINNIIDLPPPSPSGAPANDSLLWIAITDPPAPTQHSDPAQLQSLAERTYVYIPNLLRIGSFDGGGSGGNATCNVRFGRSADLSITNLTGTATVSGCSGSNSNWYIATALENATTITNDCNSPSHSPPPVSGSSGVGDTTHVATYQVFACWKQTGIIMGSFNVQAASALQTLNLPFALLLTTGLILVRTARKPRRAL